MFRNPPALFNQGAPLLKLVFFLFLSAVILYADFKLQATEFIRTTANNIFYPLQSVMSLPGKYANFSVDYFSTRGTIQQELNEKNQQLENARSIAYQAEFLESENAHLRKLLALQQKTSYKALTAEIIFNPKSPHSQKIIINRGAHDGIKPGMPVATDSGIMGQVQRVFNHSSEVVLLQDREFSIPVLVERSGVRAALFGTGRAEPLELRYVNNLAELDVGDHLVTSGIDGVYPAGIPVAMIVKIDRSAESVGATITCTPLAKLHHHRYLNVLLYQSPATLALPTEADIPKNTLRPKRNN